MKRAATILLAGVILVSCGAVAAADQSLVSKSYLDGTFTDQALEEAAGRLEKLTQTTYDTALGQLNAAHSQALAQAGAAEGTGDSAGLTDRRFKKGDVLTLTAGSGVMVLAGSATASGGALVDTAAGTTVASGGSLTLRHRCLAGDSSGVTVTVTSDTAVLSLEGSWTLTAGSGVDYNAMADALAKMGLLQGTGTAYGSGYDLERQPMRIEGLVMFIRLLGEDKAALSSTAANPFVDGPDWADRYLAYAYEKGYTNGIGTNAAGGLVFAPNNTISAGEYMTFALRALGYSESGESPDFTWQTALEAGTKLGVIRQSERAMLETGDFLRAQVVYLSCCALNASVKGGSPLLDQVIAGSGQDRNTMKAALAQAQNYRIK